MNNYVYVTKEKVFTLVVTFKENELYITYANENCCKLLSAPFPYDKQELISKYLIKDYYNALVSICKQLETDYESYQSHFNFLYKDMILPLYIHITSLTHNGSKIFFILANDLDNKDFYNTFLVDNETNNLLIKYDSLLNKPINAVAVFSCEDPLHPKIERINVKMLELAVQTSILKEPYFYEHKIFDKLLQSKSTIEDEVKIHQKHAVFHYKILLIPIIHNDIVLKAIIMIIDSSEANEPGVNMKSQLTPRENEVIEYVLLGAKNDYIAKKLNVSIGTIKRTLFNVYNKLGISSRVELINYYHSLKKDN